MTDVASFSACVEAHALLNTPIEALCAMAAASRDSAWGNQISYSRKVFIPLTQLCRDSCHYCTFAITPRRIARAYLPLDEVVAIARQGAALGCNEALFTLGDQPEDRYQAAREALDALGHASTLSYLREAAERVLGETGLLPHLNPGILSDADYEALRPVSASMGLMIESVSERLCQRGGPHFGSPDKLPSVRLEALEAAGRAAIPFTTGLLIGIGETRAERLDTLAAIRASHDRHGHIQEVIVQNFRAKVGTRMAKAEEPDLDELRWTMAAARLMLPNTISLQAPPNLSPGALAALVGAGLNDWGGVSPVTPDHVNPEAAWPTLAALEAQTAEAGKTLVQRLAIYPAYIRDLDRWTDPRVARAVRDCVDGDGMARDEAWRAGISPLPPARRIQPWTPSGRVDVALAAVAKGDVLDHGRVVDLLQARAGDVDRVCAAADELRRTVCGDDVSYVVSRNINYTNVCNYRCTFCAFSKGRGTAALRGRPYDLDLAEVSRRVVEARERGAVEVCMQGGIHPAYTGGTYLALVRAAKDAAPDVHIHAFSPLEVTHGARTLGLSITAFLERLRDAGLGTLPGTAAEVLDDDVRRILCPDKVSSQEWLDVMEAAHVIGLKTTATLMFGHVDQAEHWATHMLRIRELQGRTNGFTEFVPLPFVAAEAPLYRQGRARPGPTWREARLIHAVARLALHPLITNIQASWVKLGRAGAVEILRGGANDMGGTLMNESITRAAGASHGEETTPEIMESLILSAGRRPMQRTTLYKPAPVAAFRLAFGAPALSATVEPPAGRWAAAGA